jgi:hypothetical protein
LVLHGHEFGPHYQDSKLNIVLSGLNFPPQCHALYIVSRKKIPKNTTYIFIFTKTRTVIDKNNETWEDYNREQLLNIDDSDIGFLLSDKG